MYLCIYQGRNRSGSPQGRDQGMTDRPVLPNPVFDCTACRILVFARGWGRIIWGDLLGGCLMKAETLKYVHPFPPSPTIGKIPMSEAYGSIVISSSSNTIINVSNGSRDTCYLSGYGYREGGA